MKLDEAAQSDSVTVMVTARSRQLVVSSELVEVVVVVAGGGGQCVVIGRRR